MNTFSCCEFSSILNESNGYLLCDFETIDLVRHKSINIYYITTTLIRKRIRYITKEVRPYSIQRSINHQARGYGWCVEVLHPQRQSKSEYWEPHSSHLHPHSGKNELSLG